LQSDAPLPPGAEAAEEAARIIMAQAITVMVELGLPLPGPQVPHGVMWVLGGGALVMGGGPRWGTSAWLQKCVDVHGHLRSGVDQKVARRIFVL
jgi:hypothetical protein